jgi:molybdopterin-guanine dinucleotide biosynthesis protein A
MKENFTGFVLAGGKSSRMGTDKSALRLDGETFLERAVNALKPVCESVVIVLNQSQTIETDLPVVRDIYPERGALGAIHAAFKNCPTKFAVVLAVDLPRVSTEALENLQNFATASNKYIAFVPRQANGRPQPLCAVYRARFCLPPLEGLLSEHDSASVRDLLELIAPKYIDETRLSAEAEMLFNVNYPEDLEKLGMMNDELT